MTSRIPTLRHLAVIIALAGSAPACLAAQQRERPERPERAERPEPRERSARGEDVTRIDTTFAFSAGGSIDLTQLSGNITVTAWNRREVGSVYSKAHAPHIVNAAIVVRDRS